MVKKKIFTCPHCNNDFSSYSLFLEPEILKLSKHIVEDDLTTIRFLTCNLTFPIRNKDYLLIDKEEYDKHPICCP